MKNKKIISLTIAIVAVVLIGMLGLSKVFENSWQNENTVDNNLNVEIVDDVESVFNYKYITFNDVKNNEAPNWFVYNKYKIDDAFRENFLPYPDGAISYQDAANIAGDAITYASGLTEHQNNTAYINIVPRIISREYSENDESILYNGNYKIISNDVSALVEKEVYEYKSFNENIEFGKENESDVEFTVYIDIYTGEIYCLACDYNIKYLNENKDFTAQLYLGCSYVGGQIEKELLSSSLEISKLCGSKDEFMRYCVLEYEGYYHVYLESSFGHLKSVEFLKENNNYKFYHYATSVDGTSPYNFEFKDICI